MKKYPRFTLVLIALLLANLACGLATTERLADAIPVTTEEVATHVNEDEEVKAPEPQETQEVRPTEEAQPTEEAPVPAADTKALSLLEEQGILQDGSMVTVLFAVENPNPDLAIEDSEYQVALFDEAGTVLDTTSGYIALVLPQEKLFVDADFYLDGDEEVAAVDIQVSSGDEEPIDLTGSPFSYEQAKFIPNDYFPSITGIIKNGLAKNVSDLKVVAVAYDESGEIVGGGYTYLDFIPANGQTGVEVGVIVENTPATVELYTTVSGLSNFEEDGESAQALQLVDYGYGLNDRELGVVFIVENSDASRIVEGSQYQVLAYDADGNVLGTDSGYIDVVFPADRTAVYSSMYLPEGETLDRVEVQVSPGDLQVDDMQSSPFSVEKVRFYPGDYASMVTVIVNNASDRLASDVKVVTVAYDEAGAIVGGGYTYANFIQGLGATAVSMSVVVEPEAADYEVYAVPSGLTRFETPPAEADLLELVDYGYAQGDYSTEITFLVQNNHPDLAFEGANYVIAAYDAEGYVLEADYGYLPLVLPGEKMAESSTLFLDDSAAIDRIEVQIAPDEPVSIPVSLPVLTTENAQFKAGNWDDTVTGIVVSSLDVELESVEVTAIAYDANGFIIGGGFTFLDFVPANGQAAVEVSVTVEGTPARVELYAGVSYASELEE